jgi:hypothetical protein
MSRLYFLLTKTVAVLCISENRRAAGARPAGRELHLFCQRRYPELTHNVVEGLASGRTKVCTQSISCRTSSYSNFDLIGAQRKSEP